MTFLPVVERELRVAARRPNIYWGRTVAALVGVALGAYAYVLSRRFARLQLGEILFVALTWVAFVSCVFSGVRHTAGCISSERRDGTLGLLFLTDLKGYDIALGKLVASSISALQALLAVLPVKDHPRCYGSWLVVVLPLPIPGL